MQKVGARNFYDSLPPTVLSLKTNSADSYESPSLGAKVPVDLRGGLMSAQYLENPFIFVNSSSSSIPRGRNVRAHARTQQAYKQAQVAGRSGEYVFLKFDLRKDLEQLNPKKSPKRKRINRPADYHHWNGHDDSRGDKADQTASLVPSPLTITCAAPSRFNPLEVLAIATFHVRRTAAIRLRTHPDRLKESLRCRQWACISVPQENFGRSSCLDSALACVACKLQQMTGNALSSLNTLNSYSRALQGLQAALEAPNDHDYQDLVTATQLLAIYEMLDSVDDADWIKHVVGVETLYTSMKHLLVTSSDVQRESLAINTPLFAEALLNNNHDFFRNFKWDNSLDWLATDCTFSTSSDEVMKCLLTIPSLLLQADEILCGYYNSQRSITYHLLDQAHQLKTRLQNEIVRSDLSSSKIPGQVGTFDALGLCLAGLISLDRLIASLRPVRIRSREVFEDKTNQLCAQLLQLELGAVDAHAEKHLMSAFHFRPL